MDSSTRCCLTASTAQQEPGNRKQIRQGIRSRSGVEQQGPEGRTTGPRTAPCAPISRPLLTSAMTSWWKRSAICSPSSEVAWRREGSLTSMSCGGRAGEMQLSSWPCAQFVRLALRRAGGDTCVRTLPRRCSGESAGTRLPEYGTVLRCPRQHALLRTQQHAALALAHPGHSPRQLLASLPYLAPCFVPARTALTMSCMACVTLCATRG